MAKQRPQGVFGVLTGDVIGSTALAPEDLDKIREAISAASDRLNDQFQHELVGGPEFFRGDAWQLLLAKPSLALRTALLIRATLGKLEADTRISIAIGTADLIELTRISLSSGEVFTLSGRTLDDARGRSELTGALPERAGPLVILFPTYLHMCSSLSGSWTKRQAEAVAEALAAEHMTLEDVAHVLRVRKQSVSDILAAANWRPLAEAIRAFETVNWENLLAPTDQQGQTA